MWASDVLPDFSISGTPCLAEGQFLWVVGSNDRLMSYCGDRVLSKQRAKRTKEFWAWRISWVARGEVRGSPWIPLDPWVNRNRTLPIPGTEELEL